MPALAPKTDLSKSIASMAVKQSTTIKGLMKGRSDIYKVNPFDIQIEKGFNERNVDAPAVQAHIDNLARSIASIGLQKPLRVRMKGGQAKLLDGECRLRGVIRAIEVYGAEIRTVEVMLASKTMSDAEATLALVVDNSGLELNPLEKSGVFKRLMAYGWSTKEIADGVGCTPSRVTQLIELAAVPDEMKDMIRNGEIAPTLAWSIAKDNDFDSEATMKCVKDGLAEAKSVGQVKVTARNITTPRVSAKSVVSAIFQSADICEDVEDEMVVVSFTRSDWDALEKALKLNITLTACS